MGLTQQEKIQLLQDKSISFNELHPDIYKVLKETPVVGPGIRHLVILVDKIPKYILKIRSRTVRSLPTEMINEAYIGIFELPKLNSPHFSKILGINIGDSCYEYSKAAICDYVMYEYIKGVTLDKFIENNSDPFLIMKIVYELIHALHQAYEVVKFSHNDLHGGNIIIKEDTTPVFIDYGASQIRDENVDENEDLDYANYWKDDVYTLLKHIIGEISIYDETGNRLKEIEKDLQSGEEGFMHDFLQESYIEILELREQRQQGGLSFYPDELTFILNKLLKVLEETEDYDSFLQEVENIL